MLKFTDFIGEALTDKTHSFWEKTIPYVKEGMEHGARMMEEKLQELGYEFTSHTTLTSLSDYGYGFGIGVHFQINDNKYFLVDNFFESLFRLYQDDGRKSYTDAATNWSKPVLLSQSSWLEDVLAEVKHINIGKKIIDVLYTNEDLETEETIEREEKIDITSIVFKNFKDYVDKLHSLLLKGINDMGPNSNDTYMTTFYYKDKPYRLIGGRDGIDVMDDKDNSVTTKQMLSM